MLRFVQGRSDELWRCGMGRLRLVAGALSAALACAIAVFSQTAGTGRAVLYEGARLILGDERPPLENGAFVVQNGRISAIGQKGAVTAPRRRSRRSDRQDGDARADQRARAHRLRGLHELGRGELHARRTSSIISSARRSTASAATQSVGSSPTEPSIQFEQDQAGRQVSAGLAFLLHARHGAAQRRARRDPASRARRRSRRSTKSRPAEEARAAVQAMAGQESEEREDLGGRSARHLSEDDAGGLQRRSSTKRTRTDDRPRARHRRWPIRRPWCAPASTCSCTRSATRSWTTSCSRSCREKKPYWTTVIGLGDRSEVCNHDPFFDQSLSARRARHDDPARRAADRGRRRPDARRDPRQQRSEDDRRRRAARARHRCRH